LCFLINDNIADGRDLSWLWDVDFEAFLPKQKVDNLLAGGTRGLDLLLRLEYADYKVDPRQYEKDLSSLVDFLLESQVDWQICCTYTAMLAIRKVLATQTKLKSLYSKDY
jgi:UDP-N-acetylmuramyl tripeptide synthase